MWLLLRGEVVVCRGLTRRSSGSGHWTWSARAVLLLRSPGCSGSPSRACTAGNANLVDRGLKPGTSQAESAELVAARQKIRDLEEENKILRKAAAAVQEVVPPKDRHRLVAELQADGVRVRQACYALGVSAPPATTTGKPGRRRPGRSGTHG